MWNKQVSRKGSGKRTIGKRRFSGGSSEVYDLQHDRREAREVIGSKGQDKGQGSKDM